MEKNFLRKFECPPWGSNPIIIDYYCLLAMLSLFKFLMLIRRTTTTSLKGWRSTNWARRASFGTVPSSFASCRRWENFSIYTMYFFLSIDVRVVYIARVDLRGTRRQVSTIIIIIIDSGESWKAQSRSPLYILSIVSNSVLLLWLK